MNRKACLSPYAIKTVILQRLLAAVVLLVGGIGVALAISSGADIIDVDKGLSPCETFSLQEKIILHRLML